MKKYKKTYAIHTLAEKHTTFYLGKTKVHVSFTGGQVTKKGVNPATFTTSDPIVQLAIERSKEFENGAVTILAKYPMQGEVKIGKNSLIQAERSKLQRDTEAAGFGHSTPEDTEYFAKEIREESHVEPEEPEKVKAEEPGEVKAEESEEVAPELVEVSCKDVAKQYLQEHYGEKPARLRTIADVQECAAKYGITFKFV